MNLLLISGTREGLGDARARIVRGHLEDWWMTTGRTASPRLLMHGACGWDADDRDAGLRGVDGIAHLWGQLYGQVQVVPVVALPLGKSLGTRGFIKEATAHGFSVTVEEL